MGGGGRTADSGAMTSHTPAPERTAGPPQPAGTGLAAAAGATPDSRNRSVDFYRAVSMGVVAVGHWLGMVMVLDDDGELLTGNALELVPSLWWITWIGQVMPLFFFVGGFASATSLLSAERRGMRSPDWVAHRLRRMMAPAAVLAVFWISALTLGTVAGQGAIVGAGAVAAAIPLWFLANYTIDIAVAPHTFRWFRRSPVQMVLVLLGIFTVCELANLAGVPMLPQVNWVLGWLLFQVAGFAWQQGRLPQGRRLALATVGLWTLAVSAVALGPWPATMLHHGGLEHSPTHPPSGGFLLFGFAYCATAALAAPALNRWLTRSRRAWVATVAANSVAMSVYLWHMTAAVVVSAFLYFTDRVPQVTVGSGAWWMTKPLLVVASGAVLAVIVRSVMRVEREALLAPPSGWGGRTETLALSAAAISAGVKMWSSPQLGVLSAGLLLTVVVWFGVFRDREGDPAEVGDQGGVVRR
jgi:hypothetical protein